MEAGTQRCIALSWFATGCQPRFGNKAQLILRKNLHIGLGIKTSSAIGTESSSFCTLKIIGTKMVKLYSMNFPTLSLPVSKVHLAISFG